ncbi:MAG: DUF1836 domain-containing protein [Ruminococcus sp.]|nr:DUF1836 domain-containing protein [Ruminococcus sp.]
MEENLNLVTVDSVRSFRLPKYNEIPDVGLYLEQTAKYINGYLLPIGFEITGSMIRNYVKMGLVNNPVHKQYYKNHIAHIIAIAILKNVISLDNISVLFSKQKGVYADEVAYDYFCIELENMLFYQFGLKDSVDKVGVSVSNEKKMLRSAIIAISHITYLNSCFSEISVKQNKDD